MLRPGAVCHTRDERVGLGKRQRFQEDAADDAEDRGVGADPERERQDGDQREHRAREAVDGLLAGVWQSLGP